MKLKGSFQFIVIFIWLISCDNEPYGGTIIDNTTFNTDCEASILRSKKAATNYIMSNSEYYSDLCNSYKEALQNQINNCGDENDILKTLINELEDCVEFNFSVDCNDVTIAEVFEEDIDCNYNLYNSLNSVNVYIEEKETLHDLNLDGVNDHYSKLFFITDGFVVKDKLNQFVAFESSTYVMDFVIMSNSTSGLVNGFYKMPGILAPNPSTADDSFLSGGHFGLTSSSIDILKGGVVFLEKSNNQYSLCFDILIDLEGNCFKGNYEGDFETVSF